MTLGQHKFFLVFHLDFIEPKDSFLKAFYSLILGKVLYYSGQWRIEPRGGHHINGKKTA
jgi:hypothetical protein